MNRFIVKLSVTAAVLALTGGCATNDAPTPDQQAMISAAEFESMIRIEVRELEPLPVDEAVAAAY
jgi:predicted outer membrane protein